MNYLSIINDILRNEHPDCSSEHFSILLELTKTYGEERLSIASEKQLYNWICEFFTRNNHYQNDALYSIRKPNEHSAIPSSLFALPIASGSQVGMSLNSMDQKPFQLLAHRAGLELESIKLSGEVLCPKKDMPVFTAAMQELLKSPKSTFMEFDTDGKIINEGEAVTINYWDVLDKSLTSIHKKGYDKSWYSRKEVLESFQKTLDRITALRLSWVNTKSKKITAQSLIPYLNFDPKNLTITIRATYALYQLFRDDRILRLNRELLNAPTSSIEITLLNYLSSLRHHYSFESDQPIRLIDSVHIEDLIKRCYPDFFDKNVSLASKEYKSKRTIITQAMKSLQLENLISYEESTRKRQRVYINIECNAGLRTNYFLDKYSKTFNTKQHSGCNVKAYLSKYPLPKSRNLDVRNEYANKHLPRLVSLVEGLDDPQYRQAFLGVSTHTVKAIARLAEVHNHTPAFEMILKVQELRSKSAFTKQDEE